VNAYGWNLTQCHPSTGFHVQTTAPRCRNHERISLKQSCANAISLPSSSKVMRQVQATFGADHFGARRGPLPSTKSQTIVNSIYPRHRALDQPRWHPRLPEGTRSIQIPASIGARAGRGGRTLTLCGGACSGRCQERWALTDGATRSGGRWSAARSGCSQAAGQGSWSEGRRAVAGRDLLRTCTVSFGATCRHWR